MAQYSDRPLKTKISISIDNDVLEKIKELSAYDARPVSQYINLVLKRHVERKGDSTK